MEEFQIDRWCKLQIPLYNLHLSLNGLSICNDGYIELVMVWIYANKTSNDIDIYRTQSITCSLRHSKIKSENYVESLCYSLCVMSWLSATSTNSGPPLLPLSLAVAPGKTYINKVIFNTQYENIHNYRHQLISLFQCVVY